MTYFAFILFMGEITMIEELYSKYQASSINIRKHSLTEIDTILKQKFKAVSIDKMDYQEMKKDPYIYFDDICAGFKIMGNIVAEVQMDGEKEIAQMIVENILDDKDLSEEEKQKEINRQVPGTCRFLSRS
jgi:hypothetical protein